MKNRFFRKAEDHPIGSFFRWLTRVLRNYFRKNPQREAEDRLALHYFGRLTMFSDIAAEAVRALETAAKHNYCGVVYQIEHKVRPPTFRAPVYKDHVLYGLRDLLARRVTEELQERGFTCVTTAFACEAVDDEQTYKGSISLGITDALPQDCLESENNESSVSIPEFDFLVL